MPLLSAHMRSEHFNHVNSHKICFANEFCQTQNMTTEHNTTLSYLGTDGNTAAPITRETHNNNVPTYQSPPSGTNAPYPTCQHWEPIPHRQICDTFHTPFDVRMAVGSASCMLVTPCWWQCGRRRRAWSGVDVLVRDAYCNLFGSSWFVCLVMMMILIEWMNNESNDWAKQRWVVRNERFDGVDCGWSMMRWKSNAKDRVAGVTGLMSKIRDSRVLTCLLCT